MPIEVDKIVTEGEKNHKKGGLNCVFGNFFFYVLDNCPHIIVLRSEKEFHLAFPEVVV